MRTVHTVLTALLVLVVPVLTGLPVDASAATVAALVLATAVALLGIRRACLALGSIVTVRPRAVAAVTVASGGVTDPVHHPIRPRAPGVA